MSVLQELDASGRILTQADLSDDAMNELRELCRTPSGFAVAPASLGGLGMTKLYPWQAEVLDWFEKSSPVVRGALCTPNGAGKSSGVVAALAAWWLAIYQRGKVVITTNDSKQLRMQIIPALDVQLRKIPGCNIVTSPLYVAKTPTGGFLTAFTTSEGGRAEGYHKLDDLNGPLLIIVDEAKSVDDEIFKGLSRCTINGILLVSSPGLKVGKFHDACTRMAKQPGNKDGLYNFRRVSLNECPHKMPVELRAMEIEYGTDSPIVRSSWFGEFQDADDATRMIFSPSIVDLCLASQPRFVPGDESAFCDFAAGGDENVIAHRQGNRISIAAAWRDKNTNSACSQFILHFRRLGLERGQIWGDEGGLGRAMIDNLDALGWEINRVNNGERADDPRAYRDRAAEMWHTTARDMGRGLILVEPDDKLIAQLKNRKSIVTADSRLACEPKEGDNSMKKRGVDSPDRADAFCGAWACRGADTRKSMKDLLEEYGEGGEEDNYGRPPGCFAGG